MKSSVLLFILTILSVLSSYSQIQGIIDKVHSLRSDTSLSSFEKTEIDTLLNCLKFYRGFKKQEANLDGNVKFGLTGNKSDLKDLYKINAGIEFDNGIYPFEIDLKTSLETLVKDGECEENISEFDISFDYNPEIANGLLFENFLFINRSSNTYLGIKHRYEIGGGVIFNFYSSRKLTKEGAENEENLKELPEYKTEAENLWKCYNNACNRITESDRSNFKLNKSETEFLNKIRKDYNKANIKKYSVIRIALLIGVYYENEEARIERELLFNSVDSLIKIDCKGTNEIRWEVRPTLVFKPDDQLTIKFYPYIKLPIQQWYNTVSYNDTIFDKRVDITYDIQSSITARISEKVDIEFVYRYLKIFAPNRKYIIGELNVPRLVVGQNEHNYYMINFTYKF